MRLHELLADWSHWAWPLLANHLWQATLFALFAVAVSAALRRAPAAARHLVWLVALVKFALPSVCLVFLARQVGIDFSALALPATQPAPAALDFAPILSPVAPPATVFGTPGASAHDAAASAAAVFTNAPQAGGLLSGLLICLWLAGCVLLLVSWLRRRRRLCAALAKGQLVTSGREAETLRRVRTWFGLRHDVKLVVTPAIAEPGVWRVWRPVLVLPEGVAEQLDDDELEAVFMHELAHVERWDNLVGILQRALCCLFWFHPVIWLIDRRLLAEREQACDDTVVRRGGSSAVYASGIAKVCRYCLGAEVAGLSRAAGSDLKKRIERILSDCAGRRLSVLQLTAVGLTLAWVLAFSVVAGRITGAEINVPVVADGGAVADARFEVGEPAPPRARPEVSGPARVHDPGKPADKNSAGRARIESDTPAAPTESASAPVAAATTAAGNTPASVNQPSTQNQSPSQTQPSIQTIQNQPSTENPRAMLSADAGPPEWYTPPPEEPPAAHAYDIGVAVVKASAADYGDARRFIGRYEVDPLRAENFVLDITLERGELWLKPSHAPKRRLVRQSATDFADAYADFRLTGLLDGEGRVVGLRLNSWGRDVTARKLTLPPPSLKGNVTFRLRGYADAKVVAVAGTFNNWNQSQLLFAREGDEWVCRVNLPPGTHQYKFIVDGNWFTDPSNPKVVHDERGIENSLLRAE
ncbi:MAG TPA: M56 family metallopeptidase [Pyrinomonadaceae bacterium]